MATAVTSCTCLSLPDTPEVSEEPRRLGAVSLSSVGPVLGAQRGQAGFQLGVTRHQHTGSHQQLLSARRCVTDVSCLYVTAKT